MEIRSWLSEAKKQIDALDAELIALDVFAPRQMDRCWLVSHDVVKITTEMQKEADKMVLKRAKGEPLAYILGEKEFYGRKFEVNESVLIPRPETETLIDLVKELSLPKQPKFLELGTGSGCIAITLALEYPQAQVLAVDLSKRALDTAFINNVLHEGRVGLVQSNLLRDLFLEDENREAEHYDVLVANLPYVDPAWEWLDRQTLDFEPKKALYAKGNGGLSLYQRMLKEIRHHQKAGHLWLDYLVVEADPSQHYRLIEMAHRAGFFHLKTEGFGVVFEDGWRYWWDDAKRDFVHKPEEVLQWELENGIIHLLPEEVAQKKRLGEW